MSFCEIIFGGPTGGPTEDPNGTCTIDPKWDVHFSGLTSEVSGLKSEVSGLRSQVSGLRSHVSGLRSQVLGLRSQVSGLRCQVSILGCLWDVFWVSLGVLRAIKPS